MKKKIAVIGAGPGGLACAALLASRGLEVVVLERASRVGGRNGCLSVDGFKFDIGPTFLMMKFLLDDIFEEAGVRSEEYLKFTRLDPMYELRFDERKFAPGNDAESTKRAIEAVFPGMSGGFDRFMEGERKRFARMIPCLQRDYTHLSQTLSWTLLKAVPHLSLTKSVFDVLKGYFQDEMLALCFSFQSKYLGMSAWKCPGAFAMLPYVEHAYGVYHTEGGLSAISAALARLAEERGATIRLETPVKRLMLEGRRVRGVELESGERISSDEVVINADFAQAMCDLVPDGVLRRYSRANLGKLDLSCSTYMLYLGLDKVYPLPHHTIVFARDYRRNVSEIFEQGIASDDLSFYVRNASVTDPTLAPAGKSSLYVLVPTPNLRSGLDWEEQAPRYRALTLNVMKERLGLDDIESHIEVEETLNPLTWRRDFSVYEGATFNLAHNLRQVAFWRPRNRFEELDNCYLAGGGTHPGSGLPTIFESARISANLICRKHSVPFTTKEVVV